MNRQQKAREHASAMVDLGFRIKWDSDYAYEASAVFDAQIAVRNAIERLPEKERHAMRVACLNGLQSLETRLEELATQFADEVVE